MLDESVSPVDIASSVDDIVVRIKNRYYSYEAAASLMFSSSHHDDIDDSTVKALTIRYPGYIKSNHEVRWCSRISLFDTRTPTTQVRHICLHFECVYCS